MVLKCNLKRNDFQILENFPLLSEGKHARMNDVKGDVLVTLE